MGWTPGRDPDRRQSADAEAWTESGSGKPSDRRAGPYRRVEDKSLISRAHEEANAIRENAYREGFEEGLRQASQEVQHLADAIEQLLSVRDQALLSAADEIGGLAVEVAERIIKTEVSCDETLILALVKDTIMKSGRQNKTILVKVHPDDLYQVKHELKDHPIEGLKAELIVMEDNSIDQGSCVVETNSGMIDASFATQLEVLRQLLGAVDKRARRQDKTDKQSDHHTDRHTGGGR